MTELLASLEDINTHLPANVKATDSLTEIQIDALRLIRGQLTAIFTPAILSSWDVPANTPELIRGIAGRLIASKYYSVLVSQQYADELPGYSVTLYSQAISMLSDIKSGALVVVDEDGNVVSGTDIGSDPQGDVFPNDSTAGPYFEMGTVFG